MFTIGADPEVFVRDMKKKAFISSHNILSGTKKYPMPLYDSRTGRYLGGAYQVDGVAAEFNTAVMKLDGTRKTEFIGDVGRIFKHMENDIKIKNPYAELVVTPVADFEEKYFNSLPEENRQLGCDPDFNGWDGYPNRRPNADGTYRTGSGHIHLGWQPDGFPDVWDHKLEDNDHFEKCMALACELDYYLGLPSLLWDHDNRRRTLYGKAGAFRSKTYGMEYRVLSNVWVMNEPLTGYIYDACHLCLQNFHKGLKFVDTHGNLAQEVINGNDIEWLSKYGNILETLGHKLPEGF